MPKSIGTVVVAQIAPVPGNIRANCANILEQIELAKVQGASLIVFPELATTGYLLGDRWEDESFLKEVHATNNAIRRASDGIAVIWGSVYADWDRIGEDGRVRKYNAAFVAEHGKFVWNNFQEGWVPKTNLPKYRVFDDARHFYPAASLASEVGCNLSEILQPFTLANGARIAVAVCEDLWEDEYNTKPSRIYAKRGADLLIDISCSPWTADKWRARERMLRNRVKDAGMPILYVNAVGLQNNTKNLVWFDGDSSFIGQSGDFLWRAPQHEADAFVIKPSELTEALPERTSEGIKEVYDATVNVMHAFCPSFDRVVIGLSGGIDSAVSAALLCDALGPEKVLAINMPTKFNSTTTQTLAYQCARNLGVEYCVVNIERLYEEHVRMLRLAGYRNPKQLTLENVQARIRGASVLAAIAQEENGMFVCNGNKTEMALNYFTLYADGAGAAAFLADLWKGQIYELAAFINKEAGRDVIPQGIIDIVPSAELSADQAVDEGKGDPIFFPYHDRLLRAFTEWRWDPTQVMERLCKGTLEQKLGCSEGTLKKYFATRKELVENLKWCWTMYSKEFKRGQTPPVLMASRRAFGFDRRDTIADCYLTDRYFVLEAEYLKQEAI